IYTCPHLHRDYVESRIAGIDRNDLEIGGSEMRGALIKRRGNQGVDQPHEFWNGIICPLRVGGVALAALGNERDIERTAPPNLDRVAKRLAAGRLADDAVIEALALVVSPTQKFFGAIDGQAFFVSGNKKADRAFGVAPRRKSAGGGGKSRNAPFHIGRAAPPERALGNLRPKRIKPPPRAIANRHDIGMARKDEAGRALPNAGIKIADIRRAGL